MNYKNKFENTYQNYVPTFTFNYNGKGGNCVGFRVVDELTDDYVVLSDSISTFRLYFDHLKSDEITINDTVYDIFYYAEFPNHRFLPIEKPEYNKHLMDLLTTKSSELLMMFE